MQHTQTRPAPRTQPMPQIDMPLPERFLRLSQVLDVTGLSRSTVYERIQSRSFPAPISLGGSRVAWLASEITTWMNERISASRNA